MTAPAKAAPAASAAAPSPVAKGKKKAPRTEAEKAAAIAARKLESPEARFLRLAKPRISKAVKALQRLETVGKSPAYKFSPEQANRVMKYIDDAVDAVRIAFVNRVANRTAESISL
jgi:hypothetical protein